MKKIAIIGASGSIGDAFLSYYLRDEVVKTIYAFSRSQIKSHDRVIWHSIDIENEETIIVPHDVVFDLVIIATGVLHGMDLMPEKSIKNLSKSNFEKCFAINTIGPALVAKRFIPRLSPEGKMIFLSARVGSISDNQLGGWYAYRASKAALNMVIKNFAIEVARIKPAATILGLHPGTVDSALSKPFQSRVAENKLFSPQDAVEKMLHVIEEVDSQDSGKIFAWDGQEIGY